MLLGELGNEEDLNSSLTRVDPEELLRLRAEDTDNPAHLNWDFIEE